MEWLSLYSLPRGVVKPGSACLVAAVPEEWVETFPEVDPVTQTMPDNIVLKADRLWLPLLLVSKKRVFKQELQRSKSGVSWSQSISGRTAGQSVYIYLALENYAYHRWVLLFKEAGTGLVYIVGKPGSGALLEHQYSNEAGTISQVSFLRNAIAIAPIYNGSFTLDTNVTYTITPDVKTIFYTATGTEGTTFIPLTPTGDTIAGKTVLWVDRNGITTMEPVAGTPTVRTKVGFNSTAGALTVISTEPINADEVFMINYK